MVMSLGATALAGTLDDPNDPIERLREHFDDAVELYGRGDLAGAERELTAVQAILPAPSVLYDLAVIRRHQGREKEALAFFEEFLRQTYHAGEREDATAAFERLTPASGREPTDFRGIFIIQSRPSRMRVYIDDRNRPPLGVTPWVGSLPAGSHELILVTPKWGGQNSSSKHAIKAANGAVHTVYVSDSCGERDEGIEDVADTPSPAPAPVTVVPLEATVAAAPREPTGAGWKVGVGAGLLAAGAAIAVTGAVAVEKPLPVYFLASLPAFAGGGLLISGLTSRSHDAPVAALPFVGPGLAGVAVSGAL